VARAAANYCSIVSQDTPDRGDETSLIDVLEWRINGSVLRRNQQIGFQSDGTHFDFRAVEEARQAKGCGVHTGCIVGNQGAVVRLHPTFATALPVLLTLSQFHKLYYAIFFNKLM
jgi:hypothetical protein